MNNTLTKMKQVSARFGPASGYLRPALVVLPLVLSSLSYADWMTVSSDAFEDGGAIPTRFAGPAQCGGDNVSLPVRWRGVPSGTKSLVVTLTDPNGPKGISVTHWVAYNIPATSTSLKAGIEAGANVTFGRNTNGEHQYRGPCPPIGDTPHHYLLTVTATDLPPGVLPRGLDLKTLEYQIIGHTISGTTIVGKYGR